MTEAIEIIGRIEIGKLSLRAGDVLVARYDGRLSVEQAALVRRALEPFLPEGVKSLVIGRDFELSTLDASRGFAGQLGDA